MILNNAQNMADREAIEKYVGYLVFHSGIAT